VTASAEAPPEPRRVAAAEWLALAAGVALVLRYAWHLDDAFVYFRYVDNWVLLGRGLVFNEGEWVEGFTSPLWVLVLGVLRGATPLDVWTITRVVGVLAFIAYWAQLVALRRATAPRGAPVVNAPLALSCALYPVATYFTSGTESPLVLVTAAALARFAFEGRDAGRVPALAVGLAPLVRPELLAASLVLVAFDWRRSGRAPRLALGALVAANGAWLVVRVQAYADLLPNTFHLKDGAHVGWGLAYLHDALLPYGGYALLALGPAAWLFARRRSAVGGGAARLALLGAAACVTLYVVRVGGDGRHFRYLLFPWVLALTALSGVAEGGLLGRRASAGVVTAAALIAVTGALFPRQLDRHPLRAGVQEARVGVIRDAQYHRAQPELSGPLLALGGYERLAPEQVAALWAGRVAAPAGPSTMREEYRRARSTTAPPAVQTQWWCHECWRWFTVRWVHDHGLTDAFLARTDARPWRPGHFGAEQHARAEDLARLRDRFGWSEPGALRRAVEAGAAPQWIADNIDAVELIERKVQGHGGFLERLRLALTPVPTIEVTGADQRD